MNSRISFSNLRLCFHASLFAIFLSACGGGEASKTSMKNDLPSPVAGGINGEVLQPGSTGASPVPTTTQLQLPQVSVGQRQFADPNVLLNLRGTAVAATGSQIVKTLWTQVTGPEVVIPSPQALENMVLMPDVTLATQLEFRLTAQDSEGRVNSATVSILVKPVPTFVKVIGGVFNEADEKAVFKVRLNAPSTSPVTVSYTTQDGTANSGSREDSLDYVAASGEIIFAAGEVLKEIPITLVNDVYEEDDEIFSLQVTAIDAAATHANTGVAIIRNGAEPQLTRDFEFNNKGNDVTLYVGEELNNSVVPEDMSVIYSSSNSQVANVSSAGVVSGLAPGTVTITATKPAQGDYVSVSKSYQVSVRSRGAAPVVNIFRASVSIGFEPNSVAGEYGTFTNDAKGATSFKPGSAASNLGIGQSVVENFSVVTIDGQIFPIEVTVTGDDKGPVVVIEDYNAINNFMTGADVDGYSVQMGETVELVGKALDQEDGQLPSQSNLGSETPELNTSLVWSSNIDGVLGYGESLDINTLSQGTHLITYSVTDGDGNVGSASTRVLVGNIAPSAYWAYASSTYCASETSSLHCYYPYRVNDTKLSTALGGLYSWVNNNLTDTKLPQYVALSWLSPVTINSVDIYTTDGYILRDYDIEYREGEGWATLVSITDNTQAHRTHPVSTVTTSELRVVAKEGSLLQPQHARVNEIVVFGSMPVSTDRGG